MSKEELVQALYNNYKFYVAFECWVIFEPGLAKQYDLKAAYETGIPGAQGCLDAIAEKRKEKLENKVFYFPGIPLPDFVTANHILLVPDRCSLPLLSIPQIPLRIKKGWIAYVHPARLTSELNKQFQQTQQVPISLFPDKNKSLEQNLSELFHAGDVHAALHQLDTFSEVLAPDYSLFSSLQTLTSTNQQYDEELLPVLNHYLAVYPDNKTAFALKQKAQSRLLDKALEQAEYMAENFRPREFTISVLVSTYASQEFMAECLTDLEAQTHAERMEIIIIDAASPEDERSVVQEFQQQYDNIRYYRTPQRNTIYAAWNMAIRAATGSYLMPMSTNDRLAPDACESLSRVLDEKQEVQLVFGDSYVTQNPHETFEQHHKGEREHDLLKWPGYSLKYNLTHHSIGPHPMWRASLTDSVGYFNERYTALGDQDFFLHTGRQHTIQHVETITGLIWHSSSALSQTDKGRRESFQIYQAHRALYAKDKLEKLINTNFFTELEKILHTKQHQGAKELYTFVRSRLPESEYTQRFDKIFAL